MKRIAPFTKMLGYVFPKCLSLLWSTIVWFQVAWGAAVCCAIWYFCDVFVMLVWVCDVMWSGVPNALLPEGNGRDVYPRV